MTANKIFFSAIIFGLALYAVPARAVITISSDEVWDGVNNPHSGDGVLLSGGVYTIPDSIVIDAGVNVFLNDPNTVSVSDSITWEFQPGVGGLTFTDADSTIDVYKGGRNQPAKIFTLNMNDNPIGTAAAGAGRIINGIYVVDMMTGDPMTVIINSLTDVSFGTIDVTRSDAGGASIGIFSQGLVDVDSLANGDVNGGGGSAQTISITGETLVVGDIDTRAFRADGAADNGDIFLRALGQPEDSVGDFNANTAAVNSITLDGFVNTNAPSPTNQLGNLNLTAVKVTLDPTFTADISENASMSVTVGTVGNGFVANDLFINNSAVTPDTLDFTVFHDGIGPDTITWNVDSSGEWFTDSNWSPVAVPQANNQTAIFGSVITAPQLTVINQGVLVKGIRFDTAQVTLDGTSTGITLEANAGNATLEALQGTHNIQLPVILNSNTDVSASAGAQLDLNGTLNLNGNTLNVTGAGQVNINSVATGMGAVVSSAILGTSGVTGVSGNLTSTGTLDIDISGTTLGFFDSFGVSGTASITGLLSVELAGGFVPTLGDTFTVVSASSVSAAGLALTGPNAAQFNLIVNANSIVLQANGVPPLAASQVPEPTSLLLLVAGFGLLFVRSRSFPTERLAQR